MIVPSEILLHIGGSTGKPRYRLDYGSYKAFDCFLDFIRNPVTGQVKDGYIMKKWADLRPVPTGYDFLIEESAPCALAWFQPKHSIATTTTASLRPSKNVGGGPGKEFVVPLIEGPVTDKYYVVD